MLKQAYYPETKHLKTLINWTKDRSSPKNALFLIENLAPLVVGIKPSELLNVSLKDPTEWEDFKVFLTHHFQLQIKEIRKLNGRLQVIFYQRELLDSVLRQNLVHKFLVYLGYPIKYSLESYLTILKNKIIQPEEFPHEIGVFLGYPLKDVLGFMGLLPLPYRRTRGWRIYGEEKPSNEVYTKYLEARCMMRKIAGNIE